MSHFTTIKSMRPYDHISERRRTTFTERRHLKAALGDVREQFDLGEVREGDTVRGVRTPNLRADLVVCTRDRIHDVGFQQQEGAYDMVAAWDSIDGFTADEFHSAVNRQYAYNAVREKLDQQGFALAEESVDENGSIRLVLRRAV